MKIADAASFGAAIKKRRRELGYTQQFLAEFTGYSVSFISDLENGKDTTELGRALNLAASLGLDVMIGGRE